MTFTLFIFAFLLTFTLGLGALWLFPKIGLMDRPERYGHQRKPIPYPGGVAVVLGILIPLLSLLSYSSALGSVLLGLVLLAVTCFWDDRRGLSPFFRLGIQVLAGLLLVFGGLGVNSITNPFGAPIVLDAWQIPLDFGAWTFTFTVLADLFTLFWVVTMINAFNWVDGVPGMANSLAVVSSGVLLVLSTRDGFHSVDQTLAIALSAVILGASLAFLIFDFPKPKMLLGDTGSMTLGFLLAATALISGGKIATTLLVLGFPLIDFVWVVSRRIVRKQSPFKGDLWHFHHRLQKAGYSDRQIVLFFALSSVVFGGIALFLHTEGKLIALGILFSFMVLLALFLYSKKSTR